MAIMEIRWDNKALEELKAAVLYCKKEYGEETARKFQQQVINDSNKLKNNLYIGKIEPLLENLPEKYRSLVIGRLHKLIYSLKEKETVVYIQLLWDCRQSPEQLPQLLK